MREKRATARPGRLLLFVLLFAPFVWAGQENHDHPAPERLGVISFPTSCRPEVQKEFEPGVALLHSFAYSAVEASF